MGESNNVNVQLGHKFKWKKVRNHFRKSNTKSQLIYRALLHIRDQITIMGLSALIFLKKREIFIFNWLWRTVS